MATESRQKRVILWAHSRALSTAFFRAMNSPVSTKGLLEPYGAACTFGPERFSEQFMHEPVKEEYSFAAMKKKMEDTYPDHKVVFVKEMAFSMTGRLQDTSYFPKGYTHTFIIRHPSKAVPSYFKLCSQYSKYQPIGTKHQYEIFRLVTEVLKQKPIVIDATDLLQDPEAMLKEYCRRAGIPFDESMLHWNELSEREIKEIFEPWNLGIYQNAINQRGFRRDITKKTSPDSALNLSAEAQADLNESLVYYDKLTAHKIKLHT